MNLNAPVLLILSLALVASTCNEPPTQVENATMGIIRGSVLDANDAPLARATVSSTRTRYACDTPGVGGSLAEGEATTDLEGGFRLELRSFLGSPGAFCIDIAVAAADGQEDTVTAIPVVFTRDPAPEPVAVILRTDL